MIYLKYVKYNTLLSFWFHNFIFHYGICLCGLCVWCMNSWVCVYVCLCVGISIFFGYSSTLFSDTGYLTNHKPHHCNIIGQQQAPVIPLISLSCWDYQYSLLVISPYVGNGNTNSCFSAFRASIILNVIFQAHTSSVIITFVCLIICSFFFYHYCPPCSTYLH